jgi:DNA-binding MarR family transcriptional regulator
MNSVARGEGEGRPEGGGAGWGESGAVPGERGTVPGEMGTVPGERDAVSAAVDAVRARRRLITTIKESLRAMSTQLSLLNHQVGARVELKDVDLNCLDLLARHGPLSPTALAKRAGLHPATMTGILDRLQRGGWVVRDRDPGASDRRAVAVRPLRERGADLYRLYSGMNASLDEICAGYDDTELELLAGFLRRTTDAGQSAAADLANG